MTHNGYERVLGFLFRIHALCHTHQRRRWLPNALDPPTARCRNLGHVGGYRSLGHVGGCRSVRLCLQAFRITSIEAGHLHHSTMPVQEHGHDDKFDVLSSSELPRLTFSQDWLGNGLYLSTSNEPLHEESESAHNQPDLRLSIAYDFQRQSSALYSNTYEGIYGDTSREIAEAGGQALPYISSTSLGTDPTCDMWWPWNTFPKDTDGIFWTTQNSYKDSTQPHQTFEPANASSCSSLSPVCLNSSSEAPVAEWFSLEDWHMEFSDGMTWKISDQENYPSVASGTSEQRAGAFTSVYYDGGEWSTISGNDWNDSYCSLSSETTALSEQNTSALALGQAVVPVPMEHNTRFVCSRPGCSVSFKHNADLTKHCKTIHRKTDHIYRCAFKGCPRAHKVWTRLDSFRKHAKSHNPEQVDSLVQDSRRDSSGLFVSLITPSIMSRKEAARSRSREIAGFDPKSSTRNFE
jgi:hypothetical protein